MQKKLIKKIQSLYNIEAFYEYFKTHQEYVFKKVVPTSLMFLLTIFIYSVLRGTKDTLLIPVLGAEVISSVKLFGVFPSAILFIIIYSKIANLLSRVNLYYTITSFFLGYFAIYAFVLYPNKELLTVDFANEILEFPKLKYPLLMLGNWSESVFFIMSELWGSVMLSLMFWQFANYIYNVSEAKNTYTIFGAIGQVGLITAGFTQKYFSTKNAAHVDQAMAWQDTLQWLIGSVIVAGIVLMAIFWWMNRYVLTNPKFFDASVTKAKKDKPKMGFIESFKYIFTSKYIGLIAVLVLSYGISINLVEGVWKNQLRIQFPIQNDYSAFMGSFQIWTGVFSMISMVLGIYILRNFKWFTAAILTPVMILITGAMFFILILAGDLFEPMLIVFGVTALMMAVLIGATQNVLSKATKYALFDSTKEMAYIPLDPELKSKGKAVVDVTGARLGKSGGAVIQYLMLSLISGANLTNLTENILYVFLIIMGCWIVAVFALSKMFEEKIKESSQA
jgi:AAA family ATP:ADP antiporter